MTDKAVFLDRDNTIIADPGYLNDPDAVSLLPGAAGAVRRFNEAGYKVVVVSNQSGLARGKITEGQLAAIHERLREILLEQGARLDAIYYCPFLDGPDAVVERYRRKSDWRKPEPGMLRQAAKDLDVALEQSWMVGDGARDVLAGARVGCRTVLISADGASDGKFDCDGCDPDARTRDLADAASYILDAPPPRPTEATVCSPEDPPMTKDIKADAAPGPGDNSGVLSEIRDTLKRLERSQRYEDFSVARLVGTLAQMLAVAAGVWGAVALFGGASEALGRLALATLLQLIALTAFVSAGRR